MKTVQRPCADVVGVRQFISVLCIILTLSHVDEFLCLCHDVKQATLLMLGCWKYGKESPSSSIM
jgi:hypothetical protein